MKWWEIICFPIGGGSSSSSSASINDNNKDDQEDSSVTQINCFAARFQRRAAQKAQVLQKGHWSGNNGRWCVPRLFFSHWTTLLKKLECSVALCRECKQLKLTENGVEICSGFSFPNIWSEYTKKCKTIIIIIWKIQIFGWRKLWERKSL